MNLTKFLATLFVLCLFIIPSAAQSFGDSIYTFRFRGGYDETEPTLAPVSAQTLTQNSIESAEHHSWCQFALRANLLRWATLTPDFGVEWRFMEHWGVLVEGAWTSLAWKNSERRYALWEVAPQIRYYFSRFYVGGQFKAGAFNYKFSETGKQGDTMGGGVIGGYLLPIGKGFALDFNLGVGYLNTKYETYQIQEEMRVKKGDFRKNYWGVTDCGVTLVWTIK